LCDSTKRKLKIKKKAENKKILNFLNLESIGFLALNYNQKDMVLSSLLLLLGIEFPPKEMREFLKFISHFMHHHQKSSSIKFPFS
jgi:hypothetical protein